MSAMLKLFLIALTFSAAVLAKSFRGESGRDTLFSTKIERISQAVLEERHAAALRFRPSLGLRGEDLGIEFRLSEKGFSSRMEDFGFACLGAGAGRINCRKTVEDGGGLTLSLTFSGGEAVVFRHGQALKRS